MKPALTVRLGLPLLLCCGCRGSMNMLAPSGDQAERIQGLFVGFLSALLPVFGLVMLALVLALVRAERAKPGSAVIVDPPRGAEELPPLTALMRPDPRRERRTHTVVGALVGLTVVVLLVLLVMTYRTGQAMAAEGGPDDLIIEVTGHQWWWEFRYRDVDPSQQLTVANELHIPVGRTVRLELRSSDVIHSFWVPKLHGKQDLIPGRMSTVVLRTSLPGDYEGTCAEFCGLQHARMALLVVAEPPEKFEAWKREQLKAAPTPVTEEQRRGQQVFLQGPCVMCHSVDGTSAGSRVGPPLTHLASQKRIAANTLPNVRGHLAGWVSDPQQIKPGVRMPPNVFSPEDLHALLAYLESLK